MREMYHISYKRFERRHDGAETAHGEVRSPDVSTQRLRNYNPFADRSLCVSTNSVSTKARGYFSSVPRAETMAAARGHLRRLPFALLHKGLARNRCTHYWFVFYLQVDHF